MRVVAAVDKFKGTASAAEVAAAINNACWELGHDCEEFPLADGGDGLIEVLGGANRTSEVTGPLGTPVNAQWRFDGHTAVIEMAQASGLVLAGDRAGNRPLDATTAGTGELIMLAISAGARRIIVGLGGSATTDGGLGAVQAIANPTRLRGIEVLVAYDVRTAFVDAAVTFGAQKGASAAEIKLLTRRLQGLLVRYHDQFGVDISDLVGGGAAGGLGGGLAAVGARLVPGFELVADELNLFDALERADIVITGEGRLDAQSFEGKVVGGVTQLADEYGLAVGAIVGVADPDIASRIPIESLSATYGAEIAQRETLNCIHQAAMRLIPRLCR